MERMNKKKENGFVGEIFKQEKPDGNPTNHKER